MSQVAESLEYRVPRKIMYNNESNFNFYDIADSVVMSGDLLKKLSDHVCSHLFNTFLLCALVREI